MRFDEATARDPDLSRRYWEDPGDTAPPGGESWNDAAARVAAFVDRMNRDHPGRHIIAVAHMGVILTQIQRAGKLGPVQAISRRIDNLSVTRLDLDGNRLAHGLHQSYPVIHPCTSFCFPASSACATPRCGDGIRDRPFHAFA